ncbi:hypothetical protein CTI12_AA008670 [Artemisia annua]|uniref:RRM domain-containing protein n=1 Tax=Artemisia annua TaxID=35608 RepID=A0A2U1QBV2_ARTAN|nr:hypothetical protein CTI12_AA008670 [Artemisia annua]
MGDWQEVSRKKKNYRSKEDDVSKISTSIFITNFSESFTAKDLFHSCKVYGHVVDSYISFKRSKAGKRFGFVRFINVFNVERLVNNLCTIWVGNLKLQANIAKFQRSPTKVNHSQTEKKGTHVHNFNGTEANTAIKSFAHVVNGTQSTQPVPLAAESTPAIVLDSNCLHTDQLCNSVLGRVKEFASLSNLRTALINEGFAEFNIRYMGELWVSVDFVSSKSKQLFLDNVGVKSWFSQLKDAYIDFMADGRIAWIDIDGVPFKLWSKNMFKRISTRWGEFLDTDGQDDTYFHSKRVCIITKSSKTILENLKIIFQGKTFWIRVNEVPGWVPDFLDEADDDDESDVDSKGIDHVMQDDELHDEVPETQFEPEKHCNDIPSAKPFGYKENQSEDPFNLYPLLNKKKDNNGDEHSTTPSYPPGFTPNVSTNEHCTNAPNLAEQEGFRKDTTESVCSGHFKKPSASRLKLSLPIRQGPVRALN